MHRYLIVASAVALLAACGQKAATTADNATAAAPADNAAVAASANATPSANPAATIPSAANEAKAVDFVPKAAASDMFEVAAAKAAMKMSSTKAVKDFAAMMVKDHTKSTADLKKAIMTSGQAITPPATMPDDMKAKLDDLMKADPKDFNKKYMDGQVDAHQDALNLLSRYRNDGDVPAIKDFATMTAPVVQMHLDMAKMVRDGLK